MARASPTRWTPARCHAFAMTSRLNLPPIAGQTAGDDDDSAQSRLSRMCAPYYCARATADFVGVLTSVIAAFSIAGLIVFCILARLSAWLASCAVAPDCLSKPPRRDEVTRNSEAVRPFDATVDTAETITDYVACDAVSTASVPLGITLCHDTSSSETVKALSGCNIAGSERGRSASTRVAGTATISVHRGRARGGPASLRRP